MKDPLTQVRGYYRSVADGYDGLYDPSFQGYPANQKRLELILQRLQELKPATLIDCGCGEGTPMVRFHERGVQVWGFDFVEAMVELARSNLARHGLTDRVWVGDVADRSSFQPVGRSLPSRFDAMVATGVFPHLPQQETALNNMASFLNNRGRVFVEFRNELFALFTLNRYGYEFFRDRLIRMDLLKRRYPHWASQLEALDAELKRLFALDSPLRRASSSGGPGFDEILAKFNNPEEIGTLFEKSGLRLEKIHFYHWHAFPPLFEARFPELFRQASLDQEGSADGQGKWMASAFVVEAIKP